MKRDFGKVLIFAADAALIITALTAAVFLRRPMSFSLDYLLLNIGYFLPLFFIWISVFYILGFYDLHHINRTGNLLQDCVISFVVNLALGVGFFYIFYYSSIDATPKTILVLTLIIITAGTFILRRFFTRTLFAKLLTERVLFWGSSKIIEEIKAEIEENIHLGFENLEDEGLFENSKNFPKEKNKKPDILVVDFQKLAKAPRLSDNIVSLALNNGITVLTDLEFYEMIYAKIPPEYAAKPQWIFSNVLGVKNRVYLPLKGKLEIMAAVLLLLILFIPMAVVALISYLLSRQNPFYIQKRTGYLGKEFRIWKLRTMTTQAEDLGPLYKTEGKDKRVTVLGSFLRRFRLDEIPQLINIVKGDMSFTGPRPEWVEEVKILEKNIPHHYLRYMVKPGVTGWAQVNYKATSSTDESLEKLHYDLYYIKNMSLALDLKILFRTVKRVFTKEKYYGKSTEK